MFLRRFSAFCFQAHRFLLRYPKWIIFFVIFLFLGSVFLGQNVQNLTAIDDIVDSDFQTTPQLHRLKELFKSQNSLYLLFSTKNQLDFTSRELCDLRKWIGDQSIAENEIAQIFSPFQVRRAQRLDGKFWYLPVLDLDCQQLNGADSLSKLSESPWKGLLTPQRRENARRDLMVELSLNSSKSNSKWTTFDPTQVDEILSSTKESILALSPNIQIEASGLAMFQYFTKKGYEAMDLLNIVIVIALLLFSRFFFGSFRGGVILVSSLIFVAVLIKGILGILGWPLDVLSSNFFLMITIASIQDFIFISYCQYQGMTHWLSGFRRFMMPSFFTSLTTMIGFASLGVSDLHIIRRFGYMIAIGAFLEWLFLFFLLPAFLVLFPQWRRWVYPDKSYGKKVFDQFVNFRLPHWAGRMALLFFPLGIFAAYHLRYLEIPENTFPSSHPFQQSLENIEKTRGFRSQISWIFEAEVSNDEMTKLLLDARKEFPKLIQRYEDPSSVENYIYSPVESDGTQSEYRREFKESEGSRRWIAKTGEKRAILFLSSSETGNINILRSWVDQQCHGRCFIAGSLVSYGEFGSRVQKTLLESLWVSIGLVGGILLFIIFQLKHQRIWPIIASAFWGPMVLITSIWALDLPVYFITCLFAAALVGMAGDNAIQFIWTKRPGNLAEHSKYLGSASQLVTVAMILISVCFLGSYFAPARILGVLVAVGMAISFIGDYFLMRTWLSDPLLGYSKDNQ